MLSMSSLVPVSFLLLFSTVASSSVKHIANLPMMHSHGARSLNNNNNLFSWEESMTSLHREDEARLFFLNGGPTVEMKSQAPVASGLRTLQSNNYVVSVDFGTPPQSLLLAVDISNDAAWIPCSSCIGCPTSAAPFLSEKSTTFSPVPCSAVECKQVPNSLCTRDETCSFTMGYGGSSFTAALSKDTIHIGGDDFPDYSFGCLNQVTGSSIPPQGLLGLGRGPSSLIVQTSSAYLSMFSYCLPTFRSQNFSGSLLLGSKQPRILRHTPLLTNRHRPSLYYVNMFRILVGSKIVDIPKEALGFDQTTGAGTVIDSGTMFTRLVAPAYIAVRDEFRRQVGGTVSSLGGFDTCYDGPITAPTITFKFRGLGWTLPLENTMIHSSSGSISCLAMAAAPDNVNSVLNVIASMQQMNHRLLFDVPRSRLSIARESCTAAI